MKKILRFSQPQNCTRKKCPGPSEGGICPFAFYGFRAIFQLGASRIRDPFRHPAEIVNHIIVLLWHLYSAPVKIKWWDDNRTPFWRVEDKSLRCKSKPLKLLFYFTFSLWRISSVKFFEISNSDALLIKKKKNSHTWSLIIWKYWLNSFHECICSNFNEQ